MIKAVLFDFGGVIAEEGFYNGLRAAATENSLDPDSFFRTAEEIIHTIGYVTGKATESEYWERVRAATGIARDNAYLREQVLSRFVLRPAMLGHADRLRKAGKRVCMLSDQTDWLVELDSRSPFFSHFDKVYNSFFLKKSKRDITIFSDVCRDLDVHPEEALFIDDNVNNISRATAAGIKTILFAGIEDFEDRLTGLGL